MLAGVLERDGQQLSATQTRHQALTDADHLAVLHAIWAAETTPARHQHYTDLLLATLPPGYRTEPSHQARWLWRTLRAAELAGLDAAQILAAAIAERDLAGARDIPSVLDTRLRNRVGPLVPLPPGPWSAQLPVGITDPERRAYAAAIAALMDARKDRIGEHAADHAPPWAVTALGPVPEHPLDRLDWQRRAASIGAWRELSGHSHPTDLIGPEPVAAAPDLRAAWHEAFAALGPVDGPDVRGMPDGTLLHLRDTYPIETAWAPQWVGDELRQVRAGAWRARLAGLRATAEARAARRRGHHDHAEQQSTLAGSYQALHDAYRQRETVFAAVMADRTDWDHATRQQRHLGGCRRRRTTPPPPRSAVSPAAVRRTRAPHPGTARRAHLVRGAADRRDGRVDQGPGRRAPHLRRPARGPAEPQDPVPRTPITVTSARRFPPGPAPAKTRSCSPPSPRSRRPPSSSSAPPTVTPTGRPQIDVSTDLKRWTEQRAENPKWSATRLTPSGTTPRRSPVADIPVIRMLYQEKVLVCMEGYDELVKKSLRAKNSLEWHLEGPIGHEGDASFP